MVFRTVSGPPFPERPSSVSPPKGGLNGSVGHTYTKRCESPFSGGSSSIPLSSSAPLHDIPRALERISVISASCPSSCPPSFLSLPSRAEGQAKSGSAIVAKLKLTIEGLQEVEQKFYRRGREKELNDLKADVELMFKKCTERFKNRQPLFASAELSVSDPLASISLEFQGVIVQAKKDLAGLFRIWEADPYFPGILKAGSTLPDATILELLQAAAQIRMAVIDVDGTLIKKTITGGNPTYDVEDSLALIKFSTNFIQNFGCQIVVLTGNPHPPQEVVRIMQSARDVIFYSHVSDKRTKVLELFDEKYPSERSLNETQKFSYVGAIGDDILNEERLMKSVALPVCPSSCRKEMMDICKMVTPHEGGGGAVRDFLDLIRFAKERRQVLDPSSTTMPTTSTTLALDIPTN